MKNINNFKTEIVVSILVIISMLLVVNHTSSDMPKMIEMCILSVFGVGIIAFIALVWKEKPKDEREQYLALKTGKISFFVGTIVLTVGVIIETIQGHEVNEWVVLALGSMVIAKVITSIYNKVN